MAQNKNLDTPCFMSMVGSFENFLMIYKDVRLIWTAKLEKPAIFVSRSTFEGVNGLIVTLSDDGFLQVSYLGTEQLSTTAQALQLKDQKNVNYEEIVREHSRILKQIQQQENEKVEEPTD